MPTSRIDVAFRARRGRTFVYRIGAALVLCGSLASAAINNCPVTTSTQSQGFTGGPTYSNVTVPGGGPTTKISTFASAGCTAIDLTFANFGISTTGTSSVSNWLAPSTGNTYLSVTPIATTQTGPDTLLFATVRGTGADTGIDNGGANDGQNDYKVSNNDQVTTTVTYDITAGAGPGLYQIVSTVIGANFANGGSGSAVFDTCLQGTGSVSPTGAITSQSACNSAVGGVGVFQSQTLTLSTAPSLSSTLGLGGAANYLDLTEVFSLDCSGCGTNPQLRSGFVTFSNEFDEVPEPATFGLVGAVLLGLAGWVRRRAS